MSVPCILCSLQCIVQVQTNQCTTPIQYINFPVQFSSDSKHQHTVSPSHTVLFNLSNHIPLALHILNQFNATFHLSAIRQCRLYRQPLANSFTYRIISLTKLQFSIFYIIILDMFRALTCPSSGEKIAFTQHLVSSLSVNGCIAHRLRADCSALCNFSS
jgi:hypothetical protein